LEVWELERFQTAEVVFVPTAQSLEKTLRTSMFHMTVVDQLWCTVS